MTSRMPLYAFTLLLTAGFAVGALVATEPSGDPANDKSTTAATSADDTEDVVALARAVNSDPERQPGAKFRKGHVTPRKLDAKALTNSDRGYAIQLPSKAPIPTPTVYDDKVYVSGGFHSKEYYCFDARTGALVWGVNLDDDGPSTAAVEDDVCIVNTESCTIFALDAKTGKMLWSWWLGDPLMSTPTIANGKVYTSYPAGGRGQQQQQQMNVAPKLQVQPEKKAPPKADDAKPAMRCSHVLACFDLKTGKVLWQKWIDSDVMTAPVAVDDELHVATFAGTLYKFAQSDGKIVSARRSRVTSAPVVVGKDVFFTRRSAQTDKKVREMIANADRASQRVVKQYNDHDAVYLDKGVQSKAEYSKLSLQLDAGNGFGGGAPMSANAGAAFENIGQTNVSSLQAFQGSRLVHLNDNNFNTMGDEIFCTDPKSGKVRWSCKLSGDLKKSGGFLGTSPAAAGGHLFVATLSGEVLQIEPAEGKVVKRHKVGSAVRFQPAVQGGRIYVGTQDGKVICIDTGDAKFTGWSTWGGNSAHTGVCE